MSIAGGWKSWDTLDTVRLCLDAGVDIFAEDSCRCPCSPDGCTISCFFSTEFSATDFRKVPGFLWSLEWATLVEEHCGVEAARRVLLSLLRRVRFDQADIANSHVCCHRGRGIAKHGNFQRYGISPRPIANEDIAEIADEEGEFVDMLDSKMEQLASGQPSYP